METEIAAACRCNACYTIFATVKGYADHNCPKNPDDSGDEFAGEPERFNPLCAVDTIDRHLKMLVELGCRESLNDDNAQADFTHSIDAIYEEAYALRAYITGREK